MILPLTDRTCAHGLPVRRIMRSR